MLSFALISQLIGLSSASGTRAGGSLLLLALAAHFQILALPQEMAWMATPEAMAIFITLLAFEMYTQRDGDLRMFLGTAALASMGVQAGQMPSWAVGAVGAGIAVATLSMRQRLAQSVDQLESELFHPYRWLMRAEDCLALGLAAAALLWAPLALALVLVFTVGSVVAGAVARRLEARSRRPCPAGCGASIREEASRCPKCRADVPVAVKLDLRLGGRARDVIRQTLPSELPGLRDAPERRVAGKR